ncbi:hypothetical protein OUZ56_033153 [Daphnia magna]|uniref:Nitroreductase domain-containing protein n=1 Tax=Daphnia magna TaxID=35525 RepID=A0ABR0BAB8_9CRUS|nr:hypothetical protein OUZ56_033153 [Daphnia magna]
MRGKLVGVPTIARLRHRLRPAKRRIGEQAPISPSLLADPRYLAAHEQTRRQVPRPNLPRSPHLQQLHGRPVSDDDIRAIYELAKFGPTAANTSPARFLWVRSAEAKEKLRPTLAAGNVDKTMKAPATVIVAADYEFYEQLPKLFPHADARSWYVGNDASIDATAKQSGSLQAAYLIIAARASASIAARWAASTPAPSTRRSLLARSGSRRS